MNTLLALMALIGVLVTGSILLIAIIYFIGWVKEWLNKNGKQIFFGQKQIGRTLIGISYHFKDPHAFNALYLIGKAFEKGGKTHIDDIAKEVEELNNLKCKQ